MPVTYCDVFSYLWQSLQAMACFFDCFRVRNHHRHHNHRPHLLPPDSPTSNTRVVAKEEVPQKIRLSSLFTEEEKDECVSKGRENETLVRRAGRSDVDAELVEETKFLKAGQERLYGVCIVDVTTSEVIIGQLINHGVSSSLLDRIREVGKEFFALPLEVKQKHSRTLERFEGYGGDIASTGQSYNWNDRLHLRVHPFEQRNFKLWPEDLPNFRETLEEYTMELRRVVETILQAIAKTLNLEEDSILSTCGGKVGLNLFTRC